jgi:membrane fusion protein, multidrug efflux system
MVEVVFVDRPAFKSLNNSRGDLRRYRPAVLALAGCFCALALASCDEKKASADLLPPMMEVTKVIEKDVPVFHDSVAVIDGSINATIRAQVTGYIVRQDYREGDFIHKGQTLFEIDRGPLMATLNQTIGALAVNKALHDNAKVNMLRAQQLDASEAIAKKDLDDAVAAEQSAGAAVAASEAAVEKAKLDVNFTKIVSPIDGIAGLAKAQVGDLVGPSSASELTTVSKIDTVKAYYTITEQAYLRFMSQFKNEKEELESLKRQQIELTLEDGSVYPHRGTFYAIDRNVGSGTGTLRVAAQFPNPDDLLRPGQFVRVRVKVGTKHKALLVPQRAVTELQGTWQVVVVDENNKVDVRPVKAGMRMGSLWVIDEGLKPDEMVVVEGALKVKQGMVVRTKPYVPSAQISGSAEPPLAGVGDGRKD